MIRLVTPIKGHSERASRRFNPIYLAFSTSHLLRHAHLPASGDTFANPIADPTPAPRVAQNRVGINVPSQQRTNRPPLVRGVSRVIRIRRLAIGFLSPGPVPATSNSCALRSAMLTDWPRSAKAASQHLRMRRPFCTCGLKVRWTSQMLVCRFCQSRTTTTISAPTKIANLTESLIACFYAPRQICPMLIPVAFEKQNSAHALLMFAVAIAANPSDSPV